MDDSRRRRSREENPLPVIMSPIIAEDKETRSTTWSIHLAIDRPSSTSSGLFLLANEYNSHPWWNPPDERVSVKSKRRRGGRRRAGPVNQSQTLVSLPLCNLLPKFLSVSLIIEL